GGARSSVPQRSVPADLADLWRGLRAYRVERADSRGDSRNVRLRRYHHVQASFDAYSRRTPGGQRWKGRVLAQHTKAKDPARFFPGNGESPVPAGRDRAQL